MSPLNLTCLTVNSLHTRGSSTDHGRTTRSCLSESLLYVSSLFQTHHIVYRLIDKVAERNRSYYAKYSEDIQRVKNIIHYLQTEKVRLPSGGTLSIARFRQLGINLGFHGEASPFRSFH